MNVQNIIGFSQYTDILSIQFAEISGAPASPTFVTRSGGDLSIGLTPSIQIAWLPPQDNGGVPILGYKVEANVNGGSYNVLYDGSTNPTLLTYNFQGLTQGATYIFRVYARNVKGYSAASGTITIIAATMPPQTSVPVVSTVDDSTNTISIQWAVPSMNGGAAITGYYVQINSGYGTAFIQPGTFVAVGTNTLSFTGLIAGATYLFRVGTINTIYTSNQFPGDVINFSDSASQIMANAPGQVTGFIQ